MSYNLFLDDFREPVDSFYYLGNPTYNILDWKIVRNYDEFVKMIQENGIPETISFDHDLENSEEWMDIIGYEGIYMVSNFGRILRTKKSKGTTGNNILTPLKNISGLYVTLYNCGKNIHKKIHRLVLESFMGINNEKSQVNHIDGNRWNNHINNLEWCTSSENIWHSHNVLYRDFSAYGENHKNSMTVSQYDINNNLINIYGSVNEAGRQLNISFSNIAKCARGERKIAGGFIWKYENLKVTINTKISHIEYKDYVKNFFIPKYEEKTGYHCAKWLIDYCLDNKSLIPKTITILVHSMNPIGSRNIKSLFDTYKKIF
jgi:sulfur relay (sulfurtransferase) DsrF/TusC family protein